MLSSKEFIDKYKIPLTIVTIVVLILAIVFAVKNEPIKNIPYVNNSVKEVSHIISPASNLTEEESQSGYRESPNTLFNDYDNPLRPFSGFKTKQKIISEMKGLDFNQDLILQNYKEFGEIAGYYLPAYGVDNIEKFDIDQDKKDETVIYYSCNGCNARSREVDIIKNNEILFTAQGGTLLLEPLKDQVGFYLDNAIIPVAAGGYTKIKFLRNESNEFYVFSEQDIYPQSNFTYNDLAKPEASKLEGQPVELTGKFGDGLTQLDGIKFWVTDSEHNSKNKGYEWFWATSPQPERLPLKYDGSWPKYMFEKYAGLNIDTLDLNKTVFVVKGKSLGPDCTYYDKEMFGKIVCIPNIAVDSIEVADESNTSTLEISPIDFSDYPAKVYAGKLANIDFGVSIISEEDKNTLRKEINNEGVEFAGHYSILNLDCGSDCNEWIIVDRTDGQIYETLVTSTLLAHYEKDSRLFVTNPPELILKKYGENPPKDLYTYFYEWKDDKMQLLRMNQIGNGIQKIDGTYFYNINTIK